MIENIRLRLQEIDHKHQLKIVYACESGSRAWGFPSADSDYDVRFIYLRPEKWYLSVEDKRDVIEYPVDHLLDINGWDLRKALQLFRKSNPPLLEWLGSPIVYSEPYRIASQIRELAKTYYSPSACIYHYFHMAEGNYRQYLKGDQVWVKKYFYVLRPILAIKWIEQGYGVAPTPFGRLLERIVKEGDLKNEIRKLINQKREGAELDVGPRIQVISEFIENELNRIEGLKVDSKIPLAPYEQLDKIFQEGLGEVWS